MAMGYAPLMETCSAQDRAILDFPKLNPETDWPWWRGPMRDGTSLMKKAPTTLSEDTNLKWSTKIAGRGHASPIVVGNRIYLATSDQAKQTHGVGAWDRKSGSLVWYKELNEGGFPNKNHPKNTEATPTIACDGTHLFVTFFHHLAIHAIALDLDGNLTWQRKIGDFNPKMFEYGYAPSPLLYQQSIIIAAEYDGESFLVAIKSADGSDLWRKPRPQSISFSTPVVANVAGRDQLVMSGNNKVSSYDPKTGESIWEVDGTTFATCGTMIWEGDTVFASGGYPKAETIAIQATGSGKVLWKNNMKCYEQSMIVYQGHVYALTDNGVLYCWNAKEGTEKWKKRLKGPVSSSPVRVGDAIYWSNEDGTMYVFRANPNEFELLAENQIGEESFASPAMAGGYIYLRTARGSGADRQEYLMCFGE